MEGCPKPRMINFDLKEPASIENALEKPLQQYIQNFYHEDPNAYKNEIQTISNMRKGIGNIPYDIQGCKTLRKYFTQLYYLQSRFPMLDGGEAAVPFIWFDVYSGEPVMYKDIRYEQACVLFNIGALYSHLAVREQRQTDESLKTAVQHFQSAAGAFQYLKDNYLLSECIDMTEDVLSLKIKIMLGQAVECILEKSILENKNPTTIARIAAQIVDTFNECINLFSKSGTSEMDPDVKKMWTKSLKVKIKSYETISYVYMSNDADHKEKYGEKVTYLKAASDKIAEALKLSKSQTNETVNFIADVVQVKYEDAKKNNDFIYHMKIPDISEMDQIKGVDIVKPVPFPYNDKDVAGPDIFQRLVPMKAHEASSLYSDKKDTLLRSLVNEVEEKDVSLSQYLTAMKIEELLDPKENKLPDDLQDKNKFLQSNPDLIPKAEKLVEELAGLSSELDGLIKDSKVILDQEMRIDAQENSGREMETLREYDKKLTQCRDTHGEAQTVNMKLVQTIIEKKSMIEFLSGDPKNILASLPSLHVVDDSIDDALVHRIREILGKVDKMRTQRQSLMQTLRTEFDKDDVTAQLVVLKDGGNRQAFFDEQIKKHDKNIAYLRQNLSAQENIIQALTEANAKYAVTREKELGCKGEFDREVNRYMNDIKLFLAFQDRIRSSGIPFFKELQKEVNTLHQKIVEFSNDRKKKRPSKTVTNVAPAPSRPTARKPPLMGATSPTQIPNINPITAIRPPFIPGANPTVGPHGPLQRPPPQMNPNQLPGQPFRPQNPNLPPQNLANIRPNMTIGPGGGLQPQNMPPNRFPSQGHQPRLPHTGSQSGMPPVGSSGNRMPMTPQGPPSIPPQGSIRPMIPPNALRQSSPGPLTPQSNIRPPMGPQVPKPIIRPQQPGSPQIMGQQPIFPQGGVRHPTPQTGAPSPQHQGLVRPVTNDWQQIRQPGPGVDQRFPQPHQSQIRGGFPPRVGGSLPQQRPMMPQMRPLQPQTGPQNPRMNQPQNTYQQQRPINPQHSNLTPQQRPPLTPNTLMNDFVPPSMSNNLPQPLMPEKNNQPQDIFTNNPQQNQPNFPQMQRQSSQQDNLQQIQPMNPQQFSHQNSQQFSQQNFLQNQQPSLQNQQHFQPQNQSQQMQSPNQLIRSQQQQQQPQQQSRHAQPMPIPSQQKIVTQQQIRPTINQQPQEQKNIFPPPQSQQQFNNTPPMSPYMSTSQPQSMQQYQNSQPNSMQSFSNPQLTSMDRIQISQPNSIQTISNPQLASLSNMQIPQQKSIQDLPTSQPIVPQNQQSFSGNNITPIQIPNSMATSMLDSPELVTPRANQNIPTAFQQPMMFQQQQIRPIRSQSDQAQPIRNQGIQGIKPINNQPSQIQAIRSQPEQIKPIMSQHGQIQPINSQPSQIQPIRNQQIIPQSPSAPPIAPSVPDFPITPQPYPGPSGISMVPPGSLLTGKPLMASSQHDTIISNILNKQTQQQPATNYQSEINTLSMQQMQLQQTMMLQQQQHQQMLAAMLQTQNQKVDKSEDEAKIHNLESQLASIKDLLKQQQESTKQDTEKHRMEQEILALKQQLAQKDTSRTSPSVATPLNTTLTTLMQPLQATKETSTIGTSPRPPTDVDRQSPDVILPRALESSVGNISTNSSLNTSNESTANFSLVTAVENDKIPFYEPKLDQKVKQPIKQESKDSENEYIVPRKLSQEIKSSPEMISPPTQPSLKREESSDTEYVVPRTPDSLSPKDEQTKNLITDGINNIKRTLKRDSESSENDLIVPRTQEVQPPPKDVEIKPSTIATQGPTSPIIIPATPTSETLPISPSSHDDVIRPRQPFADSNVDSKTKNDNSTSSTPTLDSVKRVIPKDLNENPNNRFSPINSPSMMKKFGDQHPIVRQSPRGGNSPITSVRSSPRGGNSPNTSAKSSLRSSPILCANGQGVQLDDLEGVIDHRHLARQLGRLSFYVGEPDEKQWRKYIGELSIQVEKFNNHCKSLCKPQANSYIDGFKIIWEDLAKQEQMDIKSFSAIAGEKNTSKNRYRDILPWDHSRVKLNTSSDDYINATHINELTPRSPSFIATQGPIPQTFEDFWRMVWEQNSSIIVMLTKEIEGTKLKCHPYWTRSASSTTSSGSKAEFGHMLVEVFEEKECSAWKVRSIRLNNNKEKETRYIRHFQFTSWPDYGTPESPYELLSFMAEVYAGQQMYDPAAQNPMILHCSAGVGRTGSFCCIYSAIREMEGQNGLIEIPGVIRKLRQSRQHMVQRMEQMIFCFQAVCCFAQQFIDTEKSKLVDRSRAASLQSSTSFDDAAFSSSPRGSKVGTNLVPMAMLDNQSELSISGTLNDSFDPKETSENS